MAEIAYNYAETLPIGSDPNLYLQLANRNDAQELKEIAEDYADLGTYQLWARQPEEVAASVELVCKQIVDGTQVQYRIMTDEEGEDEIIGGVSLYREGDHDPNWNLGYWLIEPYRGRGIAKRAVEATLEYAIEALDVSEVGIEIPEDDLPSQHLATAIGAEPTDNVYPFKTGFGPEVFLTRRWTVDLSTWINSDE